MPALTSGSEPWHVTLTTADDIEIGLISVAPDGEPVAFEGSLTPVDATSQFRPGGIPVEWKDFSAGGGYSFYDERVPNSYAWAKNVWTLTPNVAFPSGQLVELSIPAFSDGSTAGEIRCGFEHNAFLHLGADQHYVRVDVNATSATVPNTFATISGLSNYHVTSTCFYQGMAYWGGYNGSIGTATAAFLVQENLASFGFTVSSDVQGWHIASFNGVDGNGNWSEWLIATVHTNASFRYTNSASPMTSVNWTPGSATGVNMTNQFFRCSKIITSSQAPYFLMQDGIRIVNRLGTSIPNITPHWGDSFGKWNGVAASIISGRLYASLAGGIDMVLGLDGELNSTPYMVEPGADLPNETPAAGQCWAMCRWRDWLVAAIYNTANQTSYICFGKPRENLPGQPGLTRFIWHISPCVIEGERVTWMQMGWNQGIANRGPRLYIATREADDSATHLYYMVMPENGNPIQDLSSGGGWRARTDTCTLYLPNNPWSQGVHSEKAIRQVAITSEDASDSSTMTPYASVDGDDRVLLGGPVTESAYQEAKILDDLSGRQIAPSVDFVAGASTSPPLMRALTIWSGEGVKATSTYTGRFRFQRGIVDRLGNADHDDDQQAKWELLLDAQGPRPATITDWKGTRYTVAFEQGADWREYGVRGEEGWAIDAILRFTVLARDTVWNDGSVWDSGVRWVA